MASAARKSGGPEQGPARPGPSPTKGAPAQPPPLDPYDDVPIKVVGKVGKILDVFRREGAELPLGQLSSAASIELSTTSRIVTSLVRVGLLRYDPVQRLYSPGLVMVELSRTVLTRFSFRELAHRELISLSRETGWQCYLAVRDETDERLLMYIDAVSTVGPESSEIGQRRPLHSTATGKVLLAFNDTDVRQWQLKSSTPFTHTDPEALQAELAEVRSLGYSISLQEEQVDLCSVAAPIYDAEGRVLAAFGVGTTPALYEASPQRMISAVVSKARGISSAIGLSDPGSAR